MSETDTNELEKLSREVRRRLCILYRRCLGPDGETIRTDLPGDVGVEVFAVQSIVAKYVTFAPAMSPVHRAADGPKRQE